MEMIRHALEVFFSFKAYVMLPFIMLALGLLVGMRVKDALLSALRMGVGFASIFVVFSFFVDNIRPAVEAIVSVRGLEYTVLDVGWPPLAAITWASVIAPLSILLVLGLNTLMIALNLTRTVYLDIWNYWHFALLGALVQAVTGSMWLALAATLVIAVLTIKLADWASVYVEKETALEGVTISPISVVGLLPFTAAMDFLFERIPGFRRWRVDPQERGAGSGARSLLSEPMVIGLLLGVVLGLLAAYSVKEMLELSIHLAAVMFLLPLAGELIGKGISPISSTLKERIQRRFPSKQGLYVAVDTGVLMQHRSVIVTGLLLMPISLLLAFFIPGNKVLPLGDLPNLISVMSISVLLFRGNVVRSVLAGIPVVVTYLLIATRLAPLYTSLAAEVGVSVPEGQLITAFTDGGHHLRFYLLGLFSGEGWAFWLLPGVVLLFVAIAAHARRRARE
ncbi:PTS transporter subunit IIC [Spirochaeta thermophila]|uniref:PTS EIIC type-2 domain-containing protein n=1 Tax=Winmispira thermophila (strain ATCC 49972 / DSM 6192 / RI 19.B1) TaxID=665571 RepID=E0RQE4_WINT6|nr:PTS transporter subunit IIC [Spirochaeta thermophila]ADN02920.1 hypothetical protein STHERM_c19850 [Spirochaeta thermophila DSM 6192]